MRSTERFSNRVSDYSKYRPGYPDGIFESIDDHVGELRRAGAPNLPRIAIDAGSGTGIFTRGLLARGWTVHAIEPNREMRVAAERALAAQVTFVSHDATAEATGLPDCSVALVVAAQAFHWFDTARCREEWKRVLMPGGVACLVWNVRQLGSPFMDSYEGLLLELLPEYREVASRLTDEAELRQFFSGSCQSRSFSHEQLLDWSSFAGRVASSSYAPKPDHDGYPEFEAKLRRLFDEHQREGFVRFCYDAQLTIGGL
jgi:SAM-dependent methyltransferase